jgi:hypothetical protein
VIYPKLNKSAAPSSVFTSSCCPASSSIFGDALSLMEFARRSSNFDQLPWTAVAARDGAITVFNFGKSIEIIIANTSRCETLMGKIDHEQLRTAGRLLRQHFPRFEGIRHSITHMAEFHSSVAKIRSHRVTKHPQGDPLIDKVLSMGPLFPGGDLFGQTFIAAHDGKALSYELNSASLAALRSIMDAAYRPFTPSKDH